MRRYLAIPLAGVLAITSLQAQTAETAILPRDQQVASAVLPLPEGARPTATVWGYDAEGTFVKLREGTGDMVCLASAPSSPQFHVACYHVSMEPFMARGRELRSIGVTGDLVDTVRFAEVESGKLKMPTLPAALSSLTGTSYDQAAGSIVGARPLHTVYIPGATPESTGILNAPGVGVPWIMFSGTPKAHIMYIPKP
jgi:hypothetical protein